MYEWQKRSSKGSYYAEMCDSYFEINLIKVDLVFELYQIQFPEFEWVTVRYNKRCTFCFNRQTGSLSACDGRLSLGCLFFGNHHVGGGMGPLFGSIILY